MAPPRAVKVGRSPPEGDSPDGPAQSSRTCWIRKPEGLPGCPLSAAPRRVVMSGQPTAVVAAGRSSSGPPTAMLSSLVRYSRRRRKNSS